MLLGLLGEAQLLSREGAHLYLKHQRRSGVPSVPLPTVTISPERKAFLRNTGKERSMSRMVVAHCQGHQGLLEHGGLAHGAQDASMLQHRQPLSHHPQGGTCSFQMCLLSLETWPTVSPMRAMSMLRRSTKVRMM